jgi:hypothetical protein
MLDCLGKSSLVSIVDDGKMLAVILGNASERRGRLIRDGIRPSTEFEKLGD